MGWQASDKYIIRFWQDNTYTLIDKVTNEVLLQSSLEEIDAYINLVEKGLL
jgi:hypothetical protein